MDTKANGSNSLGEQKDHTVSEHHPTDYFLIAEENLTWSLAEEECVQA